MRSQLRKFAKNIALLAPPVRGLVTERDRLQRQVSDLHRAYQFAPPGHFYSPIPSLDEVRRDEAHLFGALPRQFPDLDLHERKQLELLASLRLYYPEQPFPHHKTPDRRYFFQNEMYSYSDAIFLYCIIRHLRPRRIIEIGSGYSSAATLDTNELFFDNRIQCTFIDPCPDRLRSILKQEDKERIEVIPSRIQGVDLKLFAQLEANDILFIDSTHVAKIGSDVNRIVFEMLPALRPGVHIHFHDIFFPFEYPREWVFEGRAWNESYVLRAFLAFNSAFEIVLWNEFLARFHREEFARTMPLCLLNEGGSLWLKRVC